MKTLKTLLSRASAHDPNSILAFAGYEFEQGVAWADRQWLKVFIKYLEDDCELDFESIVEVTGLNTEQLERIMEPDIDNLMGAPIW